MLSKADDDHTADPHDVRKGCQTWRRWCQWLQRQWWSRGAIAGMDNKQARNYLGLAVILEREAGRYPYRPRGWRWSLSCHVAARWWLWKGRGRRLETRMQEILWLRMRGKHEEANQLSASVVAGVTVCWQEFFFVEEQEELHDLFTVVFSFSDRVSERNGGCASWSRDFCWWAYAWEGKELNQVSLSYDRVHLHYLLLVNALSFQPVC